MRFFETFVTLFLAGTATAGHCNGSGQQADEATRKAMATDAMIGSVCSALIGTYGGSERRSTCIEVGGAKYDFMLHHVKSDARYMGLEECKDGMRKEIVCERGGKKKYGNWQYKADYNKGACTAPFGKREVGLEFEA